MSEKTKKIVDIVKTMFKSWVPALVSAVGAIISVLAGV